MTIGTKFAPNVERNLTEYISRRITVAPGRYISTMEIYDDITADLQSRNERPINPTTIHRFFRRRLGIQRVQGFGGAYYWLDIVLSDSTL